MPTKVIYFLSTTVNGRINYVHTQMANRTSDNKKIANYTTNPADAKNFGSIKAAEAFIKQIVNPHQRIYTPGSIEVKVTPKEKTPQHEVLK